MPFKKDHIPWNTGLHKSINTGRTHFKKGFTPWNKGKKTGLIPKTAFKKNDIRLIGKNHHLWKGNKVSYAGLHMWIKRILGKPLICNHCVLEGKINYRNIQWANKSHKYKRILTDWIALCRSHHMKYDHIMKKAWITRKENNL
jgi:hypothetical protein